MNYQLPNGKVIYISIDEYLAMTDEDIQYFIASDYGDTVYSLMKHLFITAKIINFQKSCNTIKQS